METIVLPNRTTGRSSTVEMLFYLDGRSEALSIGQMGGDFIMFSPRLDLPPCEGEFMVSVDGRERRWRGSLPEGANKDKSRTPVAAIHP